MIDGLVSNVAQLSTKKMELWLLETMKKHHLIEDDVLTKQDIDRLKAEKGIRVIMDQDINQTMFQIYIKDKLVGEWTRHIEFVKDEDNYKAKIIVEYWN